MRASSDAGDALSRTAGEEGAPAGDRGAWDLWKTSLPQALPYLRPYRMLAVFSFLVIVLGAIISLAEPWPLAIMIDSVLGGKNNSLPFLLKPILGEHPDKYVLLVFAASFGFVLAIFGGCITVLGEYVHTKLSMKMVLDLRSDLFEHCQRLSLTFHDSTLTGGLMQRINIQSNAIGTILTAFPELGQAALTLIGMLVIALLIDWQVALISLVVVPFIYYALGLYGTRIVPRIMKVMNLEMQSLSIVHEAMGMLRVIVSFGRENYEFRRFRNQGETAVDARVKLTVRQTTFGLFVTAATAAGTGLVLGFGAWHVLQGKISLGELTVLIAYIAAVYQPLEQISTTLAGLHQQMVFLDGSLKLLNTPPEVTETPEALAMGRSKGHVVFENVHFSYKNRENTLKEVSFEAEPGQRIAVVGPTGAGKTTLATLLVRFYDPSEGGISIDGVDIRQLTIKSLRNQFSVVLQDPLLFSATIADNIQYGSLGAEMDQIIEAAKAANAHDFISELPDGYETEVGERGAQLSGGERQRIAVARAFIRDAPILIMDEPTSSIDSRTEGVILDALDHLMVGRTSFLIAHRLATIRGADLILVINHGQLVEKGTHEELVARDGLYRQLFEAQTFEKTTGKDSQIVPAEVAGEDALATSTDKRERIRERLIERALQSGRVQFSAPPELSEAGEPSNGKQKGSEDGRRRAQAGQKGGGQRRRAQAGQKGGGQRQRPMKGLPVGREDVACDLCGRILLKGERTIAFLAPPVNRHREAEQKRVCELCSPSADEAGWKPPTTRGQRLRKAIGPGKQLDGFKRDA